MRLGLFLAKKIFAGDVSINVPPMSINGVDIQKEQIIESNHAMFLGEGVQSRNQEMFWEKYNLAIIVNARSSRRIDFKYIDEVIENNILSRKRVETYLEIFDLILYSQNNDSENLLPPIASFESHNIYSYFRDSYNGGLICKNYKYGKLEPITDMQNISFTESSFGVYKYVQTFQTRADIIVSQEGLELYTGNINLTTDIIKS